MSWITKRTVPATAVLGLALLVCSGPSAPVLASDVTPVATDANDDVSTATSELQWFPDLSDRDLALLAPPIQLADESPAIVVVKEQAMIPLPPAAWTGLAALS